MTIRTTFHAISTARTRRLRNVTAVIVAAASIAACGGSSDGETLDDFPEKANSRAGDTVQIENESLDSPTTDSPTTEQLATDEDEDVAATPDSSGITFREGPTRFHEVDWTIIAVERRPDGPRDEGADVDPSEDFVYVDVDLVSPVPSVSFDVPYEWLTLVRPDGAEFRPFRSVARSTGDTFGARVSLKPNRNAEITVHFAIDAGDSFDGGFLELDQQGFLPAATGGPAVLDEDQRIPVSFDSTTYVGSFSRDEATVQIVDAFLSRELGTRPDGSLVRSPSNFSRRPEVGSVWLIVNFNVNCQLTGINTGGCNVGSGAVDIDGERTGGSFINGLASYGDDVQYWASYQIRLDAESIVLEIGDVTSFSVTDVGPLDQLTTS